MARQACLYQLYGLDLMVDRSGTVVLLECNSFPAMASGTMAAVPTCVYTRLVEDLLTAMVLPKVTAGIARPRLGGFVDLDLSA